jgi:hypothetical protein
MRLYLSTLFAVSYINIHALDKCKKYKATLTYIHHSLSSHFNSLVNQENNYCKIRHNENSADACCNVTKHSTLSITFISIKNERNSNCNEDSSTDVDNCKS